MAFSVALFLFLFRATGTTQLVGLLNYYYIFINLSF